MLGRSGGTGVDLFGGRLEHRPGVGQLGLRQDDLLGAAERGRVALGGVDHYASAGVAQGQLGLDQPLPGLHFGVEAGAVGDDVQGRVDGDRVEAVIVLPQASAVAGAGVHGEETRQRR